MGFENKNVKFALLYTLFLGLSGGIWGFTVLSGYLNKLTGSNQDVGLAEGIQGAVQAFAAIPSGFMADRIGREALLKTAAIISIASIAFINVTLWVGRNGLKDRPRTEFVMMCCALALYGAYNGVCNAAFEALFADSLKTEERPKFLTYKYVTRVLSASLGPLLGILVFSGVGDNWQLKELSSVMSVGTIVGLIPACFLLFLKDEYALGSQSEANHMRREETNQNSEYQNLDDVTLDNEDVILTNSPGPISSEPFVEQGSPMIPRVRVQEMRQTSDSCYSTAAIPYICASADIIFGLASGMTIKFFPLFFKDEVCLTPIHVNAIFCATPFLMSVSSLIMQRISRGIGRVQTVLCSKFVGICLLFAMYWMGTGYDGSVHDDTSSAHYDSHNGTATCTTDDKPPLWVNTWVIIPIFIMRTVLMNCATPLQKSIIMEYVPKESRAKWSAFDSITAFGWSGSAFLGGWIADKHGYGGTFLATAIMQAVGWCCIALLWPLVPRHNKEHTVFVAANAASKAMGLKTSTEEERDALVEPLLDGNQENDEVQAA